MDEIERLELRIEELREAIARSRRLRLVGLASAVIAPASIVGFVLGLVDYFANPRNCRLRPRHRWDGAHGLEPGFSLMSPNSAISLALLRAL
jgi:hypothetical protein